MRPLVLVAWEPRMPEEALAVQERLAPLARVEWIHEVSPALAAEILPEASVIIAGDWPPWLTQALASMRSLRLVVSVYQEPRGVPVDLLRRKGVEVERGFAPPAPDAPVPMRERVGWARSAAERAGAFLRIHGAKEKSAGTTAPL